MSSTKPNKKTITGKVLSSAMDKSVTVLWEQRVIHPLYKKFVKQHTKLTAHDEKNEAERGDLVRIVETRPISKNKRFRVVEIVEKAQRG
ncbi:MAG: 30S ribosomal protein S17 [Candidatus Omnitrophica bacterium]|nr:30S ribosomal protein S17 [Candidatus Omnitrophota bacterium]